MIKLSEFQKEITIVVLLKLLAIGWIGFTWFSHPPQADVEQHLMSEHTLKSQTGKQEP